MAVSKSDEGRQAEPMLRRLASDVGLKILFCLAALVCFATISLFAAQLRALAPAGEPGSLVANDFSAFWAAGKLGWSDPLGVLDVERLSAVQRWPADGFIPYFPFAYPPAWLMAMLPLGALPYAIAWPLFSATGVVVYAAALWWTLDGLPSERGALMMAALSPPLLFFVLIEGQTTLLWLTLLTVAVAALASGRAILSGAICGLLAFKPQLCPLVAVAFIAYAVGQPRARTAVPAAAVSVAMVCLLPVIHTGWSYWPVWAEAAVKMGAEIAHAPNAWDSMVSWYPALRAVGMGHVMALVAQGSVSLALAAGIALLWWRPGVDQALRSAALLLAIPLAAPTAWYYEGVAFALATVLLVAARYDRTVWRRLHLILLWALPGYIVPLGATLPLPLLTAPLATLLFAGVLREASARRAPA
ncbi:MAG: glycosyltransferase family 87 protein [Pseudomonadota bacterium]